MRQLSSRARSWILAAVPAVLVLAGCDRTPTEPIMAPIAAAKGGGGGGSSSKPFVNKIGFVSSHEFVGESAIYTVDPDGQNLARVTTPAAGYGDTEPSFSSGVSPRVAFARVDANGKSEIYSVNLDGSGLLQLTSFQARTRMPVFSPNGSKIAFVSDKAGVPGPAPVYQLFVMNADGSNVQYVAETIERSRPSWSADGKTLFYSVAEDWNGVFHTIIRGIHLQTGTTSIVMACPNAMCVSPQADFVTGRVIYEYIATGLGITLPNLWIVDPVQGTNQIIWWIPASRVGGWSKDGTRFVFAPVDPLGEAMDALQILDVTTLGNYSVSFSALPTAARIAFWPTWTR